jgi:predicted nucleic acid-binding protein
MIVLDTNVISEPLRNKPAPEVVEWLDAQPLETLYLSVITVAELRFGISRLPAGKRRNNLREHLETRVLSAFAGRILVFDLAATQAYADLMAKAQASGVSIGLADGFIAAITLANGMSVATRDTAPFLAAKVPVIDPWSVR